MPEIQVNGVKLYYEEAGSGPETVVFSSSYLMDNTHYTPQIEALKDRYRCLAYDHRGHGRSEVTEDGYEMENLYADAAAYIEALDCAPCHWVGLSTGGFIGLRLGIRRPDLVKSLILMATSAGAESAWTRLQYNILMLMIRWLGWRSVTGTIMKLFFSKNFLKDPARQGLVEDVRARIMANDRLGMIKFGKGIFVRDSVDKHLGSIKTPTLMVVGDEDKPTPIEEAERIAEGIPGAKLVIIPGAGHISTLDQPEAVNAAIEEFLAAL